MDVLKAMVLGIIEGLTEFLPVSSTGHMILAEPFLGIDPKAPLWSVLLWVSQLGAILAVIVYFWRDLWRRTFHPETAAWQEHIFTKLVVAMIPTIACGLAFGKLMKKYLEGNSIAVAGALIVGALIMEFIDRRYRREKEMRLEDVTLFQAFMIGLIQCLSMWPGTSRAAASIMGGMALGLTPRVATEFSFYLAIPTMLAAATKTLWDSRHELSFQGGGVILTGTATAFVVALLVVAVFLGYVRRYRFTPFAVYRVLLGVAVLAYYYFAPHGPTPA